MNCKSIIHLLTQCSYFIFIVLTLLIPFECKRSLLSKLFASLIPETKVLLFLFGLVLCFHKRKVVDPDEGDVQKRKRLNLMYIYLFC